MPFVKSPVPVNPAPGPDLLDAGSAVARWRAVRAMGGNAAAAPAMARRLGMETDANVRAALFAGLAATGRAEEAAVIATFLRSEDAALRNGAIEALKLLGETAAPAVDLLLCDPDSDVRLLAIEVTRVWPPALAAPRLAEIITRDPHINVCAAAVDVAAETGTAELLAPLGDLRKRFAGQPFIAFAADVARAHIRASGPRQ